MFVLDSHCDTPSQILRLRDLGIDNDHSHIDFPKLKKGRVDGAFFALYIPGSYSEEEALEYSERLLSGVNETLSRYNDIAKLATSRSEAVRNKANGHFSVFLGLENGSPIGKDCSRIKDFYEKGIRYITLCHSKSNLICDSCADKPLWNGLSDFGKDVVNEMNRLGMLIDVSHVSDKAFFDVIKHSSAPVVATHSCCRALANHPRNMTDEMIIALAENGGVIQVNFYPLFLDDNFSKTYNDFSNKINADYLRANGDSTDRNEDFYKTNEISAGRINSNSELDAMEYIEEEFIADPSDVKKRKNWYNLLDKLSQLPRPSYTRIVDHIDHVVKLVGINHVGLGSDFDGISVCPSGMEDCSMYPAIFEEMRRRGYSEDDICKVAGENFLHLL